MRAIQELDHLDRLSRLNVLTLVVAGDADLAVPPAAAARLAHAIPQARLQVLADAPHMGSVEQAVAFTECVGDFVRPVVSRNDLTRH